MLSAPDLTHRLMQVKWFIIIQNSSKVPPPKSAIHDDQYHLPRPLCLPLAIAAAELFCACLWLLINAFYVSNV